MKNKMMDSKKIEYKGYTYEPAVAIAGDEVRPRHRDLHR